MGEEEFRARNIILLNHQWLASELKDLGHNVLTASWRPQEVDIQFPWRCRVSEFLSLVPPDFKIDCIVYYDDSSLPCFIDFENLQFPKIFYSVDTHHHQEWHVEFAKLFDLTLVAQKDLLFFIQQKVGELGKWCPLWATRYAEPSMEKTIDVSFRGTLDDGLHPGREAFLTQVASKVSLDFSMGDYIEPYTRSKIVINEAVRGDVNFRVFEGMMCGAMMLTPRMGNGLFDIFTEGENIVTFEDGNVDDAVSKIEYYLNHDAERELIAKNGRDLIVKKYSSLAIAKKMSCFFEEAIANYGNSELRPSQCTVVLYASLIRYFWLFVRKYEVVNMFPHLQQTINYFDDILRAKNVVIDENDAGTEVSIVVLDALLSDLLDPESYQLWLQSMYEGSGGRISLVNQLLLAFADNYRSESPDGEVLREVFVQNRARFIESLSEFKIN